MLLSVIYIIDIILYFVTFSWIVLLEKNKCNCSSNWKRYFIKYYIIFILTIILFVIILQFLPKHITVRYSKYIHSIGMFILLTELIYVCVVFIYIKDLINNNCKCSDMPQRDITLLYSVTDIVIFVVSLIYAISLIIYRILKK